MELRNHKCSFTFFVFLIFIFFPVYANPIGFEELDGGTVWHIWNPDADYYFNATSGIQFTNHYNEYWTKNIFCAGYKDGSGDWQYDCNDVLPFTWSHITDNETYVNITGWRDKTIGTKEVRMVLRYNLELNDTNLTVIPYIENIGTEDITNDLGFAWKIVDIQIANTTANDTYYINQTFIDPTGEVDLTYNKNTLNGSYYVAFDNTTTDFLRLDWDSGLTFALEVKNQTSQINAPITLGINVGPLIVGQSKQTELYWQDPKSVDAVILDSPTSDPKINEGQTFSMQCHWTETGTGAPFPDQDLYAQSDEGTGQSTWYDISGTTGLSTADANPQTVDNDVLTDWTISGDTSDTYYIRCIEKGSGKSSIPQIVTVYADGWLNVTWAEGSQLNDSCTSESLCEINLNNQLYVNATVKCVGDSLTKCNYIDAGVKYNESSINPDAFLNSSFDSKPLKVLTGGNVGTDTSETIDISILTSPRGVADYNNAFYIIDYNADILLEYWTNGTYTGNTYSLTGAGEIAITEYDGFFWTNDIADLEVYKYYANNVSYTGFSFDTSGEAGTSQRGIVEYNGFLWIVSFDNTAVYKYWPNGTYTGTSFITSAFNDAPVGIEYHNGFFWIGDNTDNRVYKYWPNGTYTNFYFSVSKTFGLTVTDDRYLMSIDTNTFLLRKFTLDKNPQTLQLMTGGDEIQVNFTLNATLSGIYALNINSTSSFDSISSNTTTTSYLWIKEPAEIITYYRNLTANILINTAKNLNQQIIRTPKEIISLTELDQDVGWFPKFFTTSLTSSSTQSTGQTIIKYFVSSLIENQFTSNWILTVRTLSDNLTETDSLSRVGTFLKSLTQSMTSSSSTSNSMTLIKYFTSSISSSDTYYRTMTLIRQLTDSFTSTPTEYHTVTAIKQLINSFTGSDTSTKLYSSIHYITTSVTNSDNNVRIGIFLRYLSDSSSATSLSEHSGIFIKTLIDSLTSNSISFNSVTQTAEIIYQYLVDNLTTGTYTSKYNFYIKFISDILTSTQLEAHTINIYQIIVDNIASSTTTQNTVTVIKFIQNSLTSEQTTNSILFIFKTSIDPMTSISTSYHTVTVIKQLVTSMSNGDFIETLVTEIQEFIKYITTSITQGESTNNAVISWKAFVDSLTSSDSSNNQISIFQYFTGSITESESSYKTMNLYRNIVTNIASNNPTFRMISYWRIFTESVSSGSYSNFLNLGEVISSVGSVGLTPEQFEEVLKVTETNKNSIVVIFLLLFLLTFKTIISLFKRIGRIFASPFTQN